MYDATTGNFVSRDKYFGRRLDADGLRRALIQFFASGGSRRLEIIDAILDRLSLLRMAVEKQETFRFYSRYIVVQPIVGTHMLINLLFVMAEMQFLINCLRRLRRKF